MSEAEFTAFPDWCNLRNILEVTQTCPDINTYRAKLVNYLTYRFTFVDRHNVEPADTNDDIETCEKDLEEMSDSLTNYADRTTDILKEIILAQGHVQNMLYMHRKRVAPVVKSKEVQTKFFSELWTRDFSFRNECYHLTTIPWDTKEYK